MFRSPTGLASRADGTLFVWDAGNLRVRQVSNESVVSTFAGGGNANIPGKGTIVSLPQAVGAVTVDRSGTIWIPVSDGFGDPSLLRVSSDAEVSRIFMPGKDSLVRFAGIGVDSVNNVYVSDKTRNRIHRYRSDGAWEVFAGSGNEGFVDGSGLFTAFSSPAALAIGPDDSIYVWDSGNGVIRKISPSRDVTTFVGKNGPTPPSDGVGTNAVLGPIHGMAVDPAQNLILACGSSIRRVSPSGDVSTIAGDFSLIGYENGDGKNARFDGATGVCVSRGTIFVADSGNYRIRAIAFDPLPQPVTDANLGIAAYPGLTITGTPGRAYRIESSLDSAAWRSEETIVLPQSPFLWFDRDAVGQRRFYRVFLLP